MKKSAEIRQAITGLISQQEALTTAASNEKRSLNDAEVTSFNDLQKQIEERKKELKIEETREANLRDFGAPKSNSELGKPNEERAMYSLHKAIRSQMGNGVLEGTELEVHNATKEIAKRAGIPIAGIAVPLFDTRSVTVEKRADGQGVGTDEGDYGGAFVATDTQPVIDLLRPKPAVESLGAIFLTGLQGDLKFPVNDGGIAATWEGEQDNVDNSKNAYSTKTMQPKRLAVSVPISIQNLMQSSQDMEAYTMNEIATVIANAIDLAAINGSGTGQPLGILNTSGINAVAGGTNGAVPSYANIVALETGVFVGNANSAKLNYLSNAKVRGKLKTTEISSGYPTHIMAPDGTVNGYPFAASNNVPSNLTKGNATGICSAAIFGDFSQLIVGQWGFMDISVDNVSRKREGLVEITVNVFVDVLVKQPKAFSVCKDLLTT